jgi:hypothetical protein
LPVLILTRPQSSVNLSLSRPVPNISPQQNLKKNLKNILRLVENQLFVCYTAKHLKDWDHAAKSKSYPCYFRFGLPQGAGPRTKLRITPFTPGQFSNAFSGGSAVSFYDY